LRISPGGIAGTIVVLLIAGLCVRLGFWQLSRLSQRRHKNDAIEARMALPPVDASLGLRDTVGVLYRRVSVTGQYDPEHSIVLAGRSYKGEPGVYLLTPLRLGGGPQILVNRGWLPSPDAATVDLAPLSGTASGRFQGIVMPLPPAGELSDGKPGFRRLLFRLNDSILPRFPYPLAPAYIQALPEPGSGIRPTRLPPPELDDGPHLSYAIQWFSFALIGIVGWIALVIKRGT
jgi:surfeit locus 1 family protein